VFARGLLNRLFTRAYLPGDRLDPFQTSVPAERRHTLIAERDEHGLRFDIRLQGDDETVFLRYRGHSR
jgi:protocatechuate 3,4-dioxygenase alpha subunit